MYSNEYIQQSINAARKWFESRLWPEGPFCPYCKYKNVLGIKERDPKRIVAKAVPDTKRETVQPFVLQNTPEDAAVHTDEANSYKGLDRLSVSEYVRLMAHVNDIESFWVLLKRGHDGIYHHMSKKHFKHYAAEFTGLHNISILDTLNRMPGMTVKMIGRCLKYTELPA